MQPLEKKGKVKYTMPRKKQRADWGSLKTVSRNKHVLRYMANTPEGRARKSVTLNCTYMEAALERDRLHVIHADKGDRPVPTIGRAYLMWYKPWIDRRVADGLTKARTAEIYERCWRLHVEPIWGCVPVDSVKPIKVQEWLLALSKSNAKVAMVILAKIGDFAVKYEVIAANKFRLGYEMPVAAGPGKREGTYSLAEADEMFLALRDTMVEVPFVMACFGSARTGESLGVKPEEIELHEACGIKLAVVPILRRMGDSGDLPLPDGDLKTQESMRPTVIPEPYGTRIYEIAQQRIAAGVEWMADRGDGLPLNKSALAYQWGLEAGRDAIPFANLRSSWRTFAKYDWGLDSETLEFLMGHKRQGVTGEHYLKPKIENLVKDVARSMLQFRAT